MTAHTIQHQKKKPNYIKKWAYDMNRYLPKEDIQRPTGM